jgi:hypothetical protein
VIICLRFVSRTDDNIVLSAWINTLIYRGRNWARITTLVLLALSVYFEVFPFHALSEPGLRERILTFADTCLGIAAMLLLFTRPSALWFRFADGKTR